MKKKITKKYDKIFKKNPFAKKWKEKLLKISLGLAVILIMLLASFLVFRSEPTLVEAPQEYQK